MNNIDLTTTATLRPELLDFTFDSFTRGLFKENKNHIRLIINIDWTGEEDDYLAKEKFFHVLGVIDKYKFREILVRVSRQPSLPRAFMWCMRQIESQFFFNLEEDWLLVEDISIESMLYQFRKYPKLAHLRLSAFKSEEETCKNWNKFTRWNGNFFEVAREDVGAIGWAGHPSMNRSSFMKECLAVMTSSFNPEKQIKSRRFSHPMNDILAKYDFGVFTKQNSSRQIVDIGREWMIRHGYAKQGNKAWFTKWEKV